MARHQQPGPLTRHPYAERSTRNRYETRNFRTNSIARGRKPRRTPLLSVKQMQTALRVVQTLERENAALKRQEGEEVWTASPSASLANRRNLRISNDEAFMTSPRGATRIALNEHLESQLEQRPSPMDPPVSPPSTHSPAGSPHRRRSHLKSVAPLTSSLTSPGLGGGDEPPQPALDIVLRSKADIAAVTSKLLRGPSADLSQEWRLHLLSFAASPPPTSPLFERAMRPRGASSWRLKLAAAEQDYDYDTILRSYRVVSEQAAKAAAHPPGSAKVRMALTAREPALPVGELPVADFLPRPSPPLSSRAALPPAKWSKPAESTPRLPPRPLPPPDNSTRSMLPTMLPPVLAGKGVASPARTHAASHAAATRSRVPAELSVGGTAALATNGKASAEVDREGSLDAAEKEETEMEAAEEETEAEAPQEVEGNNFAAAAGEAPSATAAIPEPCRLEPIDLPPSSHSTSLAKMIAARVEPDARADERPTVTLPLLQRGLTASVREVAPARGRVVLAETSDDVQLVLTARPSVRTAIGLETAVEEAKQRGGPRPSEAFKGLIDAAVSKLEETRDEIRRCGELRDARLSAFRACAPLRDALHEIFDLMCSDTAAGGPLREDFFNLHLCLTREGFFGKEKAGTLLTSSPHAYAPPAFVRYLEAGMSVAGGADLEASDSEVAPNDLRTFGGGVKLWRTVLAGGGVSRGLLTFGALEAIAFEIGDAALTHEHKAALKPFDGDVRTSLQAYLDSVIEMKKSIVHVPSKADESITPGRLRRRTVDGTGDGSGLHAAVAAATADARRASQPTTGGGWKGLAGAFKADGVAAFLAAPPPCLKHVWPHPEQHGSEMNRRWTLLKLAVSRDGPISKASAASEFREYCRLVGKGGGGRRASVRLPLSYFDIDRAWRRVPDKNYIDLTFRHEVASRAPISHGCQEVLNEATHADEEQTVCFIKLLDLDCDGLISESDFCKAICSEKVIESIGRLRNKWQEAALALEG